MGLPDTTDGKTRDGEEEESFPMVSLKDGHNKDEAAVKYKEGKKEKGVMDIISNHADKSSLSGIIFIKSSKYWSVRIIWTVLLLASLGVLIYHLHELKTKYYSYPKQTKIELTKGNIRFPAVTFCNVNVIKNSMKEMASKRLQNLIQRVNPEELLKDVEKWQVQYEDQTYAYDEDGELVGVSRSGRKRRNARSKNVTLNSRTNNFFDDFDTTDIDDDDPDYGENQYAGSWQAESQAASFDKIFNQFTALYSKENSTARQEMGHHIQDMLIQCSFAGRKCVQKNFTLVQSSTLGNCYTIQYDKFVSRQSGPSNGLSLILYLESDEYIPGITNARGLQVVVHEPRTVPFPDDEGVAVSAGMATTIGMRKIDIKRLGQPHGECRDASNFRKKYGIRYTTQVCQKVCLMEKVRDYCGCYDERNPIINKLLKWQTKLKACQDKKDLKRCVADVKWYFTNDTTSCHCVNPCRETTYRQTISAKNWPSRSFATLIAKTICKEKPKSKMCNIDNLDSLTLSENFLKVTLYFETLDYEELEEEEDYTTFQFISDIGGTIGLYVGLSVLGAFEFVHLFGSLCRHFFCKGIKLY